MSRLLAALPLCMSLLSGCGETRHPVRQEKVETPAPQPEKVEVADQAMPSSDGGGMPSLPPGHPPMSAMQGGMPGMAAAPRDLKIGTPDGWDVVQPKSDMVQAEFALSKADGDDRDGRLTVMMAGGTIDANVQRWRGQFEDLEEKPVEEVDVSGTKVTFVDFSGTYNEMRGMMGPVTKRPGYRMLAAIIPTPDGMLFVKGYGPKNTMAKHADAFRAFVESLVSPAAKE